MTFSLTNSIISARTNAPESLLLGQNFKSQSIHSEPRQVLKKCLCSYIILIKILENGFPQLSQRSRIFEAWKVITYEKFGGDNFSVRVFLTSKGGWKEQFFSFIGNSKISKEYGFSNYIKRNISLLITSLKSKLDKQNHSTSLQCHFFLVI